jgi:uncharacterized protein
MRALWLAVALCCALVATATTGFAAFAVPPIQGHVTDTAGALSPAERGDLEQRLTRAMESSGAEVAVLVVPSLEGDAIEDVAYKTFNTWKIGRAKLDNGILLVIAREEHRVRIETGKGAGGQLTDLQSSDIIEHKIAPRLREGRTHDAIADGVDAIVEAIAAGGGPPKASGQPPPAWIIILIAILIVGFIVARVLFGPGPFFWGGGGGGNGWRGGGGGGWGGGGGGGGGGYSGGGGQSGGGGASGGW